MALIYNDLSSELIRKIEEDRKNGYINPYRTQNEAAVRRQPDRDKDKLWRPAFVRDIEKILHLPQYNRYADKTQVFSFYRNDDITRRALHVQLVSRIARNIGSVLGLNTDLIEAIALGHDIGHTPFGHAGEKFLSQLYFEHTGRYFNHNIQSARVLDKVFCRNLSLQTLDGIICHNGEFEAKELYPTNNTDFKVYDEIFKNSYGENQTSEENKLYLGTMIPSTLEGCVVRLCDMIAYIGKDRQDAITARLITDNDCYSDQEIGKHNATIINNLTVDIIENSYGKDYIRLSDSGFAQLKKAKDENYKLIYLNEKVDNEYKTVIAPMFKEIYEKLLYDLIHKDENSVIFKHHIAHVDSQRGFYTKESYLIEAPDDIVTDYIASMTDDYFLDLYAHLFPNSTKHIEFKSYFEDI